jgi:sucrose-phosphate synthase
MHLALGGCLKAPPIRYGITADTGGHIAYVLNAATAQANLSSVNQVSIVTRLFDDEQLGFEHSLILQRLGEKITIDRIATDRRTYLEKEALASDLPAIADAFCDHLRTLHYLPDVIHAHFSDAAAVVLRARKYFNIPLVYTPHALGLDKRAQQSTGHILERRIAVERHIITVADAIVVSTRDEADRQVHGYGVHTALGRTVCLPPGVPHRERRSGLASLPSGLTHWLHAPDKPIVLAIARPVRKKNLAGLVRAFSTTPGLSERANLVILAGQHGGRQSLEEQEVIQELKWLCSKDGVLGRVALPCQHHAEDVSALYGWAAVGGVFANPALHEPFGLTLIEAAAAGVPVVATRNGGPTEIVEMIGHGLLVNPQDETAIGKACLRIISDRDLHHRLSTKALLNVARYDWINYATRSVSLYASICRAALTVASGLSETPIGNSAHSSPSAVSLGARAPIAEQEKLKSVISPADEAVAA